MILKLGEGNRNVEKQAHESGDDRGAETVGGET